MVVHELAMTSQVLPVHGQFFQDIAGCLRQVSAACQVLAVSLPLRGSALCCLVRH